MESGDGMDWVMYIVSVAPPLSSYLLLLLFRLFVCSSSFSPLLLLFSSYISLFFLLSFSLRERLGRIGIAIARSYHILSSHRACTSTAGVYNIYGVFGMICKVGKRASGREGAVLVMYTPSPTSGRQRVRFQICNRGSVCIQLTPNSPSPIILQKAHTIAIDTYSSQPALPIN